MGYFPRIYQAVNAASDGDNTVIASVNPQAKIRIINYALVVTANGTIIIKDNLGTEYARFTFASNGGVSFAGTEFEPALELARGTSLVINNAAGVDTTGHICFVYV